MISDRSCDRHRVGCWGSAGSAVLSDVPAEVRLGVLLDQDPEQDLLLGLTARVRVPDSIGSAAATDPFLGIPRWGGCAYAGHAGDRSDPDE
jgi:hypothetical protein